MNLLGIFLFPFAVLYGILVALRNKLFDVGVLRSRKFEIPIISVGNLAAGGTGKTPHIEYLIRLLKDNYNVATLSRGYGRKTRGFIIADDSHQAVHIGDEPSQFYSKFKDITVVVDERRPRGVSKLLKKKKNTDVVLLDDAYQHRYISPGLNILLTDYHKLYSRDFMMPYGTLREPRSGAKRADIIIVTKTPEVLNPILQRNIRDVLNPLPSQHLFFSHIQYGEMLGVSDLATPLESGSKMNTIVLFAGIANTYPLEDYLKRMCSELVTIDFPDHHTYTKKDLLKIEKVYNDLFTKNKIIVTTEKDVMRLRNKRLQKIINRLPIYYIPIKVTLHNNSDQEFNKLINEYVEKNKRNR